jgi:hypothetical protein
VWVSRGYQGWSDIHCCLQITSLIGHAELVLLTWGFKESAVTIAHPDFNRARIDTVFDHIFSAAESYHISYVTFHITKK